MKKIILYSSCPIFKIKQTGGIKRFLELLKFLPEYADVKLYSGDTAIPNDYYCQHVSMSNDQLYDKEWKYAIKNYKHIKKLKKEHYNSCIVFDVPPGIWLSILKIPNMVLMLRKDMIEYKKIQLRDDSANKFKQHLVILALELAEAITINHAKSIIVQCEYDKNNLLKRHPLLRERIRKKIKVQINNVNPSWSKDVTELNVTSNQCDFKVATISDFSNTRKGFDIFLEAVSQLINDGVNIRAFVAGDGKLLSKYKKKYAKYKQIVFEGRINNPSHFIKKMDLSVVPSRADSCPNTVMEALYNEVPVIGARSGGIPEILNNSDWTFDVNSDSLAKLIVRYTNESELLMLKEMQQGRKKELSFNWAKSIFDILNE